MNLGRALKNSRTARSLTQGEVAIRSGITQTYLSQIESNSKEPNLSTLKVISSNLDIPLPILFFLAMDEEDIHPEKRNAFEIIGPSLRTMVNEFFKV